MILTLKNSDLEKLIDICDKNYISGSSKLQTKYELALALNRESDVSELKLKKKTWLS
ncbi:MAG: hypothetical protein LUE86_05025 [Clostridiales bacterium]|nr:hypothetical protein [Clostridiales bacterium]